jgi:hypothetical protein
MRGQYTQNGITSSNIPIIGFSDRVHRLHFAIARVGATPFHAIRGKHDRGGVDGLFDEMFHYFNYRRDDFLAHYHQRPNVESTAMMIKTNFDDPPSFAPSFAAAFGTSDGTAV